LDEAIASHIKKKFNLIIGERTAEEVKIQIGSALPFSASGKEISRPVKMEVRGRDSLTGLPRIAEISSDEVTQALTKPLSSIVDGVKGFWKILHRTGIRHY